MIKNIPLSADSHKSAVVVAHVIYCLPVLPALYAHITVADKHALADKAAVRAI